MQPCCGSHRSSVQKSPSLHWSSGPELHTPAWHSAGPWHWSIAGQSVPDAAMQRRLARRLNGAEAALAKLQAATHPKQIRRLRTKARVVLRGFLGAVRRGSRVLGPNLERQLERSVKTAIATLTPS